MPSFRLGRLPGKIPVGLRDLTYYAAGPLPQPRRASPSRPLPTGTWTATRITGIAVPPDSSTASRLLLPTPASSETFPTADQVVSYYMNYTGGQDSGVVLSDFLSYVKQNGFYGHSVSAYAPVSVSDVNTLKFAIDAYDFAYVGITVSPRR